LVITFGAVACATAQPLTRQPTREWSRLRFRPHLRERRKFCSRRSPPWRSLFLGSVQRSQTFSTTCNRFKSVLLSALQTPKMVSICGERVPLEDKKVWEILDQEFLVAVGNEPQVLLWMKRARRYFPYVEKRLKELFLPDDLKYVTITESGLRPHAVSSSGAAGILAVYPLDRRKVRNEGKRGHRRAFRSLQSHRGRVGVSEEPLRKSSKVGLRFGQL